MRNLKKILKILDDEARIYRKLEEHKVFHSKAYQILKERRENELQDRIDRMRRLREEQRTYYAELIRSVREEKERQIREVEEAERRKRSAALELIHSTPVDELMQSFSILTSLGRKQLKFNAAQERLWETIKEIMNKEKPIRIVVLKARRVGVSTFFAALIFALLLKNPNTLSRIVGHDSNSSSFIYSMVAGFLDFLPPEIAPAVSCSIRTQIKFSLAPPIFSSCVAAPASRPALGSGELIHYLHLTEVAKWPQTTAEDVFISLMQTIPNQANSLVVVESTAIGSHNLFHNLWLSAERGKNNFVPVFLPWQSFPEYFLPPKSEFSSEELAYGQRYNLSDGQLEWARATREDKCRGDWASFHQEYPAEPELAFQYSSSLWIRSDVVMAHRDSCREADERGRLTFRGSSRDVEFVPEPTVGEVYVWERPLPGTIYAIGVDVGQGVGSDFHVAQVIKLPTEEDAPYEQVAMVRSNLKSSGSFSQDLFALGFWYNTAIIGVETNAQGVAVAQALEHGLADCIQTTGGYPNIFYRYVENKKHKIKERRIGWQTTSVTKHIALASIRDALEHFQILIRDELTLEELSAISYDVYRKKWVVHIPQQRGTKTVHDDAAMAIAIAYQVALWGAKSAIHVVDGGF